MTHPSPSDDHNTHLSFPTTLNLFLSLTFRLPHLPSLPYHPQPPSLPSLYPLRVYVCLSLQHGKDEAFKITAEKEDEGQISYKGRRREDDNIQKGAEGKEMLNTLVNVNIKT